MTANNAGRPQQGPNNDNGDTMATGDRRSQDSTSSQIAAHVGFLASRTGPVGSKKMNGNAHKSSFHERTKARSYRKSAGRRNAFDVGSFGKKKVSTSEPRRISLTKKDTSGSMAVNNDTLGVKTADAGRSQTRLERLTVLNEDSDGEQSPGRTSFPYSSKLANGAKMELTPIQTKAFREVFDLFDCNGGGTIDAHELDSTLRSVGIQLTEDEILQVLQTIDFDGNGEIDFDEFLELMTNTERFIESMALPPNGDRSSRAREHLLFNALTEFMKQAALKSMDEIVGYYSTKYRKFQKPHVVNHYAAGARLIGLTEKQLKEHIEYIKANNATEKGVNESPYATPLHIITSAVNVSPFKSISARHARRKGRILLSLKVPDYYQPYPDSREKTRHCKDNKCTVSMSFHRPANIPLHHVFVEDRGYGWVNQRTEHVAVKLPPVHLQKLGPFAKLTTEDIPSIRKNVQASLKDYRNRHRRQQVEHNLHHWEALDANLISPRVLRDHFRLIFSHYSHLHERYLVLDNRGKNSND